MHTISDYEREDLYAFRVRGAVNGQISLPTSCEVCLHFIIRLPIHIHLCVRPRIHTGMRNTCRYIHVGI